MALTMPQRSCVQQPFHLGGSLAAPCSASSPTGWATKTCDHRRRDSCSLPAWPGFCSAVRMSFLLTHWPDGRIGVGRGHAALTP